jgi:pantoate--beta-alanine ligase
MKPEVLRTIAALRERISAWRREGASVGMVPTMGALHQGHLALVRAAQRQCSHVVVTLFVNPSQFAPTEDLSAYPRTEQDDHRKLSEVGADLLFAPHALEMYPPGFATSILVGGPSSNLETEFRPHFFAGVATVVAKLLLAGLPHRAFFGEKDFQQLLVVKKLVQDLNIPTEIIGCPTVREPDGLAMSSRNAYLSPGERERAPELHATLREAALRLRHGADAEAILKEGRCALATAGFAVDYLAFRNAETLAEVQDWSKEPIRILAAARIGKTRLIDNLPV